jgi:hypothetical protein
VRQDLPGDVGVVDGRDQAQAPAAPRAGEDIDVKGPL